MSTLYILGNGFDLKHNMETKYSHFMKFLKEHKDLEYKELAYKLEELFPPLLKDWKNFEEALEFPDPRKAKELEMLNYHEHFIDELKKALTNWIKKVNSLSHPEKKLIFKPNSKFLTFNYTSLLEDEKVYGIDHDLICHIHNYVISGYYFPDGSEDLIFGHGNPDKQNKNTLYGSTYKNSQNIFNAKQDFFNNLVDINDIVVIGFSYSMIDKLYFEKINDMFPNAFWELNVHNSDDVKAREEFIKKIKIKNFIMEEIK